MMPNTFELAAQILRLKQLHDDWTISEMAAQIGLPPLFIINALDHLENNGAITRDRDKDTLTITNTSSAFDTHVYGQQIDTLKHAIAQAVRQQVILNSEDINEGLMYQWLIGTLPYAIELAIDRAIEDGILAKYDLSDPKDKKSIYTFLTLPSCLEKQYGRKQFKNKPAKKVIVKDDSGSATTIKVK